MKEGCPKCRLCWALCLDLRKSFARYCFDRLYGEGITPGQFFVIIFVGKRSQTSPKEICQGLKLDAGHLNRTLARLCDGGFITQRKSDADKRVTLVSLTEKGDRIFKLSHDLFDGWDAQALAPLDAKERRQLLSLIARLAAAQAHNIKREE